jgi:hypothetical protein
VAASVEPRRGPGLHAEARKIPALLCDGCFNCLFYSHRVATCRLPRCCLRCHRFGHLARDYKTSKSAPKGGGMPRRSACVDDPPASQCASAIHRPRMGPCRESWGVPMAIVDAGDDAGSAGLSRRQTSAWARLPTTPTMPLIQLPHAVSSSQIRWRRRHACAQDLPLGSTRSTRCWMSLPPCSSQVDQWSHHRLGACMVRTPVPR